MPPKGSRKEGYKEGSSPERQALARAITALVTCVLVSRFHVDGRPIETRTQVSRLMGIHRSTLTGYESAASQPKKELPLQRLWTIALRAVGDREDRLPVGWQELNDLRRAAGGAAYGLPSRPSGATGPDHPADLSEAASPHHVPAPRTPPLNRRQRLLALPVPTGPGDRQRKQVTYESWQKAHDIIERLAAGQHSEARIMLQHAGGELSPEEIYTTVTMLRQAREREAAEIVLRRAGGRGKDVVAGLALLLVNEQYLDEVCCLLRAAAS